MPEYAVQHSTIVPPIFFTNPFIKFGCKKLCPPGSPVDIFTATLPLSLIPRASYIFIIHIINNYTLLSITLSGKQHSLNPIIKNFLILTHFSSPAAFLVLLSASARTKLISSGFYSRHAAFFLSLHYLRKNF